MTCVLSPAPQRHYFACRLEHALSLTALGAGDGYVAGHQRRHADLINGLLNPRDERVTYDLRLISAPHAEVWFRGAIEIALLGRLDGVGPDEAARHAHGVLHLLDAYFDEYTFALAAPEDVRRLLAPFPVRHLVEVARRAGMERIDSLRPRAPRARLGFRRAAPEPAAADQAGTQVFHVYPFLPTFADFGPLLKLMLLEPHPVAVSCRLRATALRPGEQRLMEEAITACERALQVQLSDPASENLLALRPGLRDLARAHASHQSRQLFGLRDNAGLLALELASPEPLPAPLVDALGALVTEPAGGTRVHPDRVGDPYLAGGYDVVEVPGGPADIAAFTELDFALRPHPEAPAGGERLPALFDSVEAAAAFRLPPATLEPAPGLPVRTWRVAAAPRELPATGCLVARSRVGRTVQAVRILPEDRRRHVYVVGQTGTGKTTLLKTMILDDMKAGAGLCLIDPHGDLFEEVLGHVPAERVGDVVVLDPTDPDFPVGLNLLEWEHEIQRYFIAQEIVGITARLLRDEYGSHASAEFAGPMFYQHLRMNILLAMSDPGDPGTLLKFYQVFQEKDYWKRWLPLRLEDPLLERWVAQVLPRMDYTRQLSDGGTWGSYLSSKFEPFVYDPRLRLIFGQERSTIDLRRIMDEGGILLVNLSKGELMEANARFLGMVLIAKLMSVGLTRGDVPEARRRLFHVYVDEFQSLATQNFVNMLSEARKFGISLVLANQFLSQIDDPRIVESVFGNVGTIASFRAGLEDAARLEQAYYPTFNRFDLTSLPNWAACLTTLIEGRATRPFSIETVLDGAPCDPGRAQEVRLASRGRHGRPRAEVERELARGYAPRPTGAGGEKAGA